MQGVAPVPSAAPSSSALLDEPLIMHAVDALSSEPLKVSGFSLAPGFSISFFILASRTTSRMKESLMAHLMHVHAHVHVHVHVHVHCTCVYCVYHTIHCIRTAHGRVGELGGALADV